MSGTIQTKNIELTVHEKFAPLYSPKRYKVGIGGRAGMKSHSFAEAALLKGTQAPLRVMCTREHQVSIKDSVHRLLADKIELHGLQGNYSILRDSIIGRNGTEFTFKGLRHNIGNVKSLEGIDICWVEEANFVPEYAWEMLTPTIRKQGSEIWVTYNPDSIDDPCHQRFVLPERDDVVIMHTSYLDNPWLSAEVIAEAEFMRTNDPEAYAHIWGGQVRTRTEAQVFGGKYLVEPFEVSGLWNGPYYGADWGFSNDPTTLVRCWIGDNNLYIDFEAWGRRVELDDLPKLFDTVPHANRHTIRADNARPETISYMRRNGYGGTVGCEKWKGSVEDGVEFMRGTFKKIIVHPRCVKTLDELRLYSYKVDRLTGDVLAALVDKHNHCIDAIRYALQPAIKRRAGARSGAVTGNY